MAQRLQNADIHLLKGLVKQNCRFNLLSWADKAMIETTLLSTRMFEAKVPRSSVRNSVFHKKPFLEIALDICIADISHYRHYRQWWTFSSWCPFSQRELKTLVYFGCFVANLQASIVRWSTKINKYQVWLYDNYDEEH